MNCPKCDTDMEILDYNEEYREGWGWPDTILQSWNCKCHKCGYIGTFTKLYELKCEEWDNVE